MPNENEQVNRVVFESDEQSKAKLLKAYNDLSKAQERVAKEGLRAGDSFETVAKESRTLAKAQGDVITTMRALDKEWANQVAGAKEAATALDDYESRLKSVQASGADLSGDIAGGLGGLRGASGALGLGGATDAPLGIAQGFADIGEFAPKLKVQLEGLGDTMRAGTGAASGLASGAGDAIGGFLGISGSLGTLLAVALPVAAALAGLAIVTAEYNRVAEEQRKQLSAVIEAQRSVNQSVAEGLTSDAAQARIEELTAKRAAEAETLAALNTAYGQLETGLEGIDGGLGLVSAAVKQFDSREEELVSQLNTSSAAVAGYDAEIAALTKELESGSLSANDTAAAEAELATIREQETQKAIMQAEQATARIGQLQTQQASLLQNRAQAEQNASELEAFDRRVANEDELAETQAHLDSLAALQQAGNDRILALNQQITDVGLELVKSVAEIQVKGTAELGKSQTEYFKNSIKANEDYQRDLARSNTEFAKSQKRLAEDINKSLNDAYRENDVIAFLKAQEEGNTQLKRNAEDAKDSEKQKAEDFVRSQEEQRAAFQERQAEILLGIEDEKQKVIQAANEKRAALAAQIEQEKVATQQAIANANIRYQQSEALEAQQLKRTQERQAIITAQQDAAFQRQIANIQAEISAQNSLYATISAGISRIQAQASALGASRSSSSSYSSPSYDSPLVRGGGAFGGRGASTTNINMTVGDIATGRTVSAAMEQVMSTIGNVFQGSS